MRDSLYGYRAQTAYVCRGDTHIKKKLVYTNVSMKNPKLKVSESLIQSYPKSIQISIIPINIFTGN